MLNKNLVLSILTSSAISLTIVLVTLATLDLGSDSTPSPLPQQAESGEANTGVEAKLLELEEKLDQLTASQAALVSDVENHQHQTVTQTAPVTTTESSTFEPQVIYLGSASTTSRDWIDTGVEITLNSTNYPAGVTARFEAGLSIIGGEAWARLKNKSSGAVFVNTQVTNNTSTTTWKGSDKFGLHHGNNTYVVQLRSSSGETARLDGARIILE